MYCHWRSSYQEGRVGILLNGFNPPHFFACPKTGPGFPTSLSHGLFLFLVSEGERWYWWHCWPSLLFLVSEGERWYWWHCWPSLFILPFLYALHISIDWQIVAILENVYCGNWQIVAILENVYCGNVCVVYIYPLPVSPCY